jgi:hypothetical protein
MFYNGTFATMLEYTSVSVAQLRRIRDFGDDSFDITTLESLCRNSAYFRYAFSLSDEIIYLALRSALRRRLVLAGLPHLWLTQVRLYCLGLPIPFRICYRYHLWYPQLIYSIYQKGNHIYQALMEFEKSSGC